MAWVTLDANSLLPGEPLTSAKALAFYQNVFALAEGLENGPLVQTGWHPYNKTTVGDNNDGLIWDHSVDGGSGPFETPDFEDGYQYALLFENVQAGSGGNPTAALQVEAYSNQTTSWFSQAGIASEDGSIEVHGIVVFSLPRLVRKRHGIHWIDKGSGDNYIDARFNAGGTLRKVDKVRFEARYDGSSANFTSGKAYLLRQREYITG